jgi:phosphoglycolate phosphatase
MVRAFIFDLDGTLADTLADIGNAMNGALTDLGLPTHPAGAYRRFVGEGVEVLVRRALPPDRLELTPALTERYLARYAAELIVSTVPYHGVPELLDALVERKMPLGVLSNKPDASTRRMVVELLGRWPFAAVAGRRPEFPRKPDPAAALDLAARLGVAPAEVAFCGDTAVDMQTATAAGMIPIGCAWGFRPEELAGAGARHIVKQPMDILGLL